MGLGRHRPWPKLLNSLINQSRNTHTKAPILYAYTHAHTDTYNVTNTTTLTLTHLHVRLRFHTLFLLFLRQAITHEASPTEAITARHPTPEATHRLARVRLGRATKSTREARIWTLRKTVAGAIKAPPIGVIEKPKPPDTRSHKNAHTINAHVINTYTQTHRYTYTHKQPTM